MILRGILDSSLNGQLCFRGFAPIQELARISRADYTYQRNPIEGREDIVDFLEKENYLFFPEIILSYKFKHDFSKSQSSKPPLTAIQNGTRSFKSNVDRTEFKIRKVDYKSQRDSRGTAEVRVIELILNDGDLEDAIENKKEPFHRIDGNHRLRAAEESDSSKVSQMVAPFCILLGEEFYENEKPQENKETKVFDKSIKVFFHNINTKTIPLTSEQNLKVIIDDSSNFPNDELKEILGPAALRTRELIAKQSPENFSGISHIIKDQYRSYYMDVFRNLIERGFKQAGLVKKVLESLQAINVMYNENDSLKANSSFGLLTAFLIYHVQGNKGKFNFFKNWVLNNHIFEVEEIKTESLIKIFDKISERNIEVFVAMPYYEHDPDIVRSYNEAYERVINRIKEENQHITISLIPIMEYQGKTRDIIDNMIKEINRCSIFIADITQGNPNVGYELGIARALKKPSILVRRQNDEVAVPFDYEHDTRNTYNSNAIHTLENIAHENIVAILKEDYGLLNERQND